MIFSEPINPFYLPNEDLEYVLSSVGNRFLEFKGKTVYITGGSGFIGKWLIGTLLCANNQLNLNVTIKVLTRNPDLFLLNFKELQNLNNLILIKGDVCETDYKELNDCDFVIHAATDVAEKATNLKTLEVGFNGTKKLLEAISKSNLPVRFLLLSSGAVYGDMPNNLFSFSEKYTGAPSTLKPSSAYSESKRISELLCSLAIYNNDKINITIARCFTFVGPHLPLNKHFAIGNFILSALNNEDIKLNSNGKSVRSYLYSADLAYFLWMILLKGENGQAYNIGDDNEISILDLALEVKNATMISKRIIRKSTKEKSNRYVPNLNLIKSKLGLHPKFDLQTSIKKTFDWYKFI